MPTIKLQSSDEIFEVDVEIVKCSVTIKNMLDSGNGEEVVPLPNVSSAVLRKVIQWATFHKDDPPPTEEDDFDKRTGIMEKTDDIPPWDAEFLKAGSVGTLFELIMAANYLDIKGLMDVTCKAVANKIKGVSIEEIRRTFSIKDESPAADGEQVGKRKRLGLFVQD